MSEKTEGERIAILETEVFSMKKLLEQIDVRLRATERSVWIGFGVIAAIQIFLNSVSGVPEAGIHLKAEANDASTVEIRVENLDGGNVAQSRLRFIAGGNVGAAVITPSTTLHFGGVAALWFNTEDGDLPIGFYKSAHSPNGVFMFLTGTTTPLFGLGTTDPTEAISLNGDNDPRKIWMERSNTDNTGQNLTIEAGGASEELTDYSGGTLFLRGGISTGTGSSAVHIEAQVAGASGSDDNSFSTHLSAGNGLVTVPVSLNATNNVADFGFTTLTNFVLNQLYTNANQRSQVSASFTLTAAAAGTARVTLVVAESLRATASAGPLASLVEVVPITRLIPPGVRYYFTNETSGIGASVALVSGTGSIEGL